MTMTVMYFEDFYGSTASIKKWGSRWILRARLSNGEIYHKKSYSSYRGAKIALGKIGDAWYEKRKN